MNIAQRRDFYKLTELTEQDIFLIKKIAIEPSNNPILKRLNNDWIEALQAVFRIKNSYNKLGDSAKNADHIFEEFIITLEEDLHSRIEGDAISLINKILDRDLSIFNSEEEYMALCFFMATQYTRTNKIQETIIKNCSEIIPGFAKRSIGAFRIIFATNIAYSLFSERKTLSPCLIINNTDTRFIAGDQPIVNTHAFNTQELEPVSEVEFYYPFSPNIAVIISKNEEYKKGIIEIEKHDAEKFNNIISSISHEQIYAQEKNDLTPHAK